MISRLGLDCRVAWRAAAASRVASRVVVFRGIFEFYTYMRI